MSRLPRRKADRLRARLALRRIRTTPAAAPSALPAPIPAPAPVPVNVGLPPDFELRQGMAEVLLGEPAITWWMHHADACPFVVEGGQCSCSEPLWLSGLTRTVCVTPYLETSVYTLH